MKIPKTVRQLWDVNRTLWTTEKRGPGEGGTRVLDFRRESGGLTGGGGRAAHRAGGALPGRSETRGLGVGVRGGVQSRCWES